MSEEPEQWKPVPDGPGYEVSWDGNFRSLDRKSPSGRDLKGQPIKTSRHKDGYLLVKYWDVGGKRVTRSAHSVVLRAFAGECPPGQQSRHLDDNGSNNRWRPGTEEESHVRGGNLFYGDGRDQHRDKVRNNGGKPLPVSPPAHDCINHEQCGGKTRNPGKRCLPCVEQVGRDAGDMLRGGENLLKVAQHFGFTDTRWVFSLAVKHGGYRGTKEQALRQRRKLSQRVAAAVRNHLRRGDGGSRPGRQQGGKAATAPFGRVSHQDKLGQSRAPLSQVTTQCNGYERTPAPPLPADVTHRERRPFGRARNR